jgi:hypothetical protein
VIVGFGIMVIGCVLIGVGIKYVMKFVIPIMFVIQKQLVMIIE